MSKIKKVSLQANTVLAWRVLAVLLIGALLAKWTWVVFSPKSDSVLPALQADSTGQAEHLFGVAAPVTVTAQAALPNVKLVGVFAPDFAIFELDGKKQTGLVVGHDVVAGSKLVEVAGDHVVIEQGGIRRTIALEGKASAIKSAEAATISPAQTLASPVQVPPAAQLIQPGGVGL